MLALYACCILHDELSSSGNFEIIQESKDNLLNSSKATMQRSKLDIDGDCIKLPKLYWTPKIRVQKDLLQLKAWPINIRPHIMHFRRLIFSYTE